MPRFGTKTLLFAFVLFALWFSTFGGYPAGNDVRASVLLMLFLTAGYAAVYGRGRTRAFWAGFFAVMLLMGGNFFQGPVNKYIPNFSWRASQISPYLSLYQVNGTPAVAYAPVSPQPYIPPSPSQNAFPVPLPAQNMSDLEFALATQASIEALWMLALGCVVGLIGTWLYSSLGTTSDAPE